MQQENEELATINLDPIGGRRVSAEELGEKVSSVIDTLRSLFRDPNEIEVESEEDEGNSNLPPEPELNFDELKKYAVYAGIGIGGLWLIRLAMSRKKK
jgi:hypothetical protein